ncbi:MAG: hypothetical protein MUC66_05685 [Methanolinea sp.]|jgi:hypothetical protein|nr:hypothetical protein [Methanolinea sp.]
MGGYLDRRMKHLIEEWNLATRNDLGDLYSRLHAIEDEARTCAGFEATASAKLTELEKRLEHLKGMRR